MFYLKLISESVAEIFSDSKDLYYVVSDDYGNREYRKYRGEIVGIMEEEYFKAFYGELYEPMVARFGDRSTSRCWDQDGSLYVCYYQESVIYKFDRSGSLLRKYEEMGQVDTLYVSDMGNEKVCRINLDTLEVETYLELDGPVFHYERIGDEEFVRVNNELFLV